ncbi:MAG: HEAT repeat domain-containing protein [Acidobacteriota bacterium]|nr:HEAT repeat domain-containing protein [Acidobacteriota bacterium]
MTLRQITLAAAFALTAAPALAQVPPTPPTAPVAPVAPVSQAAPVLPLAPLPPMPHALFDEHRLVEHAMTGLAPIEWQSTMAEAELAFAKMPLMDAAGFNADLHKMRVEMDSLRAFESYGGQTTASEIRQRESSYYETGRAALDRRNWTEAITRFEQVLQLKGTRADAAMYWKAYAQARNGQRAEAATTINAMQQAYPQSRYLNDAKALDVELRRTSGQPVSVDSQQDEDLKLLAIQGLQHSDPEQAVPLLEKILSSSNSPRVKERALYVLAQSSSNRARDILLSVAKGGGNPDLQRKAIDYLSSRSPRDGASMLEEVYRSNSDPDVRMRVLRAYGSSGDRARLLAAAQNEQSEELRSSAIRYLGSSGAIAELGQLYDKEESKAIRLQIVRSLASAGAIERLQQIARVEKEPEIRMQAIRSFASVGRERTGTVLQDMYASETTPEGKRAIVQALHSQNNPEGLVAIARRENDPKLKEQIVRSLSTMTKSKVALDYLMEILNK